MTPLVWSELSALKLLPSWKIACWGIKVTDYLLWLIVLVHQRRRSIAEWSSLYHGNPERKMKSTSERPRREESEGSEQWERNRQRDEYAPLLSSLLQTCVLSGPLACGMLLPTFSVGLLFWDNPLRPLSQTHPERCFIDCLSASQHGQIGSEDCHPGQRAWSPLVFLSCTSWELYCRETPSVYLSQAKVSVQN